VDVDYRYHEKGEVLSWCNVIEGGVGSHTLVCGDCSGLAEVFGLEKQRMTGIQPGVRSFETFKNRSSVVRARYNSASTKYRCSLLRPLSRKPIGIEMSRR
jgi:hypothetical protein